MAGDALTNQNTLAVLELSEMTLGGGLDMALQRLEALADAGGAPFLNVSGLFDDTPSLSSSRLLIDGCVQ